MFIHSINNSQNVAKSPNFGSAIHSKVILRYAEDGFYKYIPLQNTERGIVGVYQQLANRVKKGKDLNIIYKLSNAIQDFNKDKLIGYTHVGIKNRWMRLLLTGAERRINKDLGIDFVGCLGRKDMYARAVEREIVHNVKNRVRTRNNEELGIELIVEGPFRQRKLVDVNITTLQALETAKPYERIDKDKKVSQGTFAFWDEIVNPIKTAQLYD